MAPQTKSITTRKAELRRWDDHISIGIVGHGSQSQWLQKFSEINCKDGIDIKVRLCEWFGGPYNPLVAPYRSPHIWPLLLITKDPESPFSALDACWCSAVPRFLLTMKNSSVTLDDKFTCCPPCWNLTYPSPMSLFPMDYSRLGRTGKHSLVRWFMGFLALAPYQNLFTFFSQWRLPLTKLYLLIWLSRSRRGTSDALQATLSYIACRLELLARVRIPVVFEMES